MRYAVGLLFSEDRHRMAILEKKRPTWMAGLLNAPGGKIEPDEDPLTAVKREFLEETGVAISAWKPTSVMRGKGHEVHFFAAFSDNVYRVKKMTDESVFTAPVQALLDIRDTRIIPGLAMHMLIALDDSGVIKPVMISANLKGG